MNKSGYYIKLFLILSSLIIIVTLSSCIKSAKKRKINNLVVYKSSHIIGYKNRPIIVDRLFINTMQKIDRYAKKYNVYLYVTSSFRTPRKQNHLTNTVVKPANRSNHLAGHAIDINIVYKGKWYDSKAMSRKNFYKLPYNVKAFLNAIRKDKSIRWGGEFKREDPVHIDDHLNKNYNNWYHRYIICQKEHTKETYKKQKNNKS